MIAQNFKKCHRVGKHKLFWKSIYVPGCILKIRISKCKVLLQVGIRRPRSLYKLRSNELMHDRKEHRATQAHVCFQSLFKRNGERLPVLRVDLIE